MQMPYTNSEGMKMCMTAPSGTLGSHVHTRDPLPPYATCYGRPHNRPSSAPMRRQTLVTHTSQWRDTGHTSPRGSKIHPRFAPTKGGSLTFHGPFASQKREAFIQSTLRYPQVDNGRISSMAGYDSLNDPYLEDYFTRRFGRMASAASARRGPHPPSGRKPGSPRGRPSSAPAKGKNSSSGKEVMYKVAVTTGDRKNAGTDAKVFLKMKGKKGKLQKTRLTKKAGSVKNKKAVAFMFRPGTTHMFKIKSSELGELETLTLEHDGLEKKHSWFVDCVEVTNMATKKSWLFICNQWLSLFEMDCQLCRVLHAKRHLKTEYEIVTVTGDCKGAGTDANVSITIYGDSGGTAKIPLKNRSKDCFERLQSDIFTVNSNCVGAMRKLRIEHDNTGFGPGWFLDRIVVTDLKHPKWKYYFPCGQWLSKTEGDGAISRDLVGSSDPLAVRKANRYKVSVYTGDKRGAGTDANVYITMFGELGDSGERKLDTTKNNFERNMVDEFILESPKLGRLERIRIGHDNAGASAGWFLDKVIIDDMDGGIVFEFPCKRWFATDEDDGLISRDLILNVGADDPIPGIPYQISVTTGDERQAGTSARVFIVLHGGKGGIETSGKIWLENGNFERARTDVFDVEVATNLSPLTKIEIGHDDSGPGPGWFLEKVVVNCPSAGVEQTYLCNKWFATDEGEGVIERVLHEHKSMRKNRQKMSTWFVWVYTTDERGAGTDANVYMVVYGDKKKSDTVWLRNKTDNFEQGQLDKFKIETCEVGKPFKIRVGHDDDGLYAGWHLDRVELENMATKEHYVFRCGRWFAKDEDDGEIVREMPAEGKTIKKPLPLVKYNVAVHTGNKRGAGTDANVFLEVHGEYGDTGERPLSSSKTNKNKFERGNVDEFTLEAVTLKKMSKIRIGHDGKGSGDGWFLEKVVIKEEGNAKNQQVFECNRWLAVDEDDGAIVREITSDGSQLLSTTSYHVSVKTGDVASAGTDADVHIKIFGKDGDTGLLMLRSSDNTSNKFERGRVDKFKLEATDIGKVERIRIGHDSSGPGSGWFLDEVKIDVPSRGENYRFACHRWLDEGEEDGKTELELEVSDLEKGDAKIPYEVTVWTGDTKGGGTDANVILRMYGEGGKTEEFNLRNRTDNFEQGQQDKFKIEAIDIGPLQKIRIGHDGTGMFAGWFLDKLLIQRYPAKNSKRKKKPLPAKSPKNRRKSRVAVSDEDEEIDSEEEESRTKKSKKKKSFLKRHKDDDDDKENKKDSSKENDIEDYWFVCNRWFAKSEDDGRIVRELVPTSEDGKRLDGLDDIEYNVKVVTGDIFGAGTDANVFVNITGENGDTGERALEKSNNINKFERAQEDVFTVSAVDLGKLKKVKIRHDNKGGGGAWFLDYVEVENTKTKNTIFFPCQRWLATDEDDGQIARDLVPVDKSLKRKLSRKDSMAIRKEIALETKAEMTTYHVYVTTGDVWGAGTDANVYVILYGEQDDTGKMFLKSSLTNKNKFERAKVDEFVLEAVDIGDLRKIKIGHDNAGGGAAWHLDKVDIDAPSLGKKWKFPCGRWLSTKEDDGLIERELVPQDLATEEYEACIPYEVTTYTSDMSGSSTDADVYIVIYGKENCTEKKSLCSTKKERKKCFERKSVDKFVLELEDVGDSIEKIRIGHDGSGWGAGWHLDKVEVRRLKEGNKGSHTHMFPCKRWLARDEDDGAIERELVPSKIEEEIVKKDGTVKKKESEVKNTLSSKKYTVNVITGDIRGAGTDANVFLTFFGDKGDTGERKLANSETHRDKFERNQTDVFSVEAVDLGKIYKAKIRHDNSMLSPAWFLDRIEVVDKDDKNETYVFHCERWLGKNKDDGKIDRTLYVKGYDGDMSSAATVRSGKFGGSTASLDSVRTNDPFSKSPRGSRRQLEDVPEGPTIPYTIKVVTADGEDNGTDSNVWIRIHGPKKKVSRQIFLELAQKTQFAPGSIETFSIEAIEVSEIKKIEIGHDGVTPGSGWFLKEVVVDMPTKGKHYTFSCKQWLAKDKSDGKTSRLLSSQDGESIMTSYKALVPYEATFYTGDVQGAGCDAEIFMQVFGVNGTTREIVLDKAGEKFERGRADLIKLELDDVSSLKKLRIGHRGKGTRPEWFLEKVELRNMDTGDLTVFKCNKWFSKSKEDNKMVRDLPATVKGKEQVKKTTYKVTVKTSDVRGAGTDANVFVLLFGENGDSGDLHLAKSETFKDPFENNQDDVFTFPDLLSLGELAKCRVWHDNKGLGAAWHLAHIEVEDVNRKKKFMFPCNKWLSKSEDDKQILRELTCASGGGGKDSPGKDRITYEITAVTSDKKDGGMIHNAWIILKGEKKRSKPFIMENSAKNKVLRRGQTDSFKMTNRDLGKIEGVILGACEREDRPLEHGASGREVMWHCHEITVRNTVSGNKYIFPCKAWITITEDVSEKHGKELTLKDMEESKVNVVRSLAAVKYEIVVITGDVKGAGTNANVSITIFGENGDTGKRALTQRFRDLFERNQTDKFQIEALDLGELTKIKVEHDNAGFRAGWFLSRVEITNQATNKTTSFPCEQWFEKGKGDGEICREILAKE